MRRSRQQETPIADAFLPELRAESAFLNRAIQADTEALKNEAARFQFAESKKDALRRDYDWNNKVELDTMTDELLGGFVQGINGIDPNDPESRAQLSDMMGQVPPQLYNNKALQGAYGLVSGQVAKNEQVAEHKLDNAKSFSFSLGRSNMKNMQKSGMTLEFMNAVADAGSEDEVREMTSAYQEASAGVDYKDGIRGISASLNGPIGKQILSGMGVRSDETEDNIFAAVAMSMGHKDLENMSNQQLASIVPEINEHLEDLGEKMNTKAIARKKDTVSYAKSAVTAVRGKLTNTNSRIKSGKGVFVSKAVENGMEKKAAEERYEWLKSEADKYELQIKELGNPDIDIDRVDLIYSSAIGEPSLDANGKPVNTGDAGFNT